MTWANKLIFFLLSSTIVWTALAYGTVHQPMIALFYLVATLIVIFWAVDAWLSGVLRINKNLVQAAMLATVIYAFFQIIPFGTLAETAGVAGIPRTISIEPFWTKIFALHFLALLIFLAAFLAFTDSTKRLKKLVWLITIFGFLFAFFAILQSVLSPNKIYGIYETRFATPFGSFVNRHNFAAYMEMTIAVPLGLMFVGAVPKDRRLLFLTAIGLMGIALLLSGSRGGLLALLAEIFFLVILTTKTGSYGQFVLKVGLSAALFVMVIAGAILIGGESSLTRIAETATSAQDISTNRLHIWSVTLEIIKNNPLFGAGFGAFGAAYTVYDTMGGIERVEQAHNDYLQVLADGGIIALLIGAFFVFWLFRTGLRSIKTKNNYRRGVAIGALSGCFAILIHSIFDFVLHTTAVALLFVTLVSLVVVSGEKNVDDADEEPVRRRKKKRSASVASIEEKRRSLQK